MGPLRDGPGGVCHPGQAAAGSGEAGPGSGGSAGHPGSHRRSGPVSAIQRAGVENVTVKPSPLWLQYRLTAIGLNPINKIVDMTNYIMAELAQPMHAFDRDLLKGETIFVRPARDGEYFLALNEQDYTLSPANLVIADAKGAIAVAGVIGGLDSAIWEKTTRIVIESATFQAASVRRTSAALKLRTDASMRFEKSQDPANTVRGLARAVELMQELSPGARLVGG